MDAFLRRRGPLLHAPQAEGTLHTRSAGLAALVYTNHIHAMAAVPKREERGGRYTERSGDKTEPTLEKRECRERQHTEELEGNRRGKDNPTSEFELEEPHEKRQHGAMDPPMDIGEQLFGKLHYKEGTKLQGHLGVSGELNKAEETNSAWSSSWQQKMEWLSSPVKKMLKPYMAWKEGVRHEGGTSIWRIPKETDGKPLKGLTPPASLRQLKRPVSVIGKTLRRSWKRHMQKRQTMKERSTSSAARRNTTCGENDKWDIVEKFEEGFFASTSRKPRESRRKTVKRILKDSTPGLVKTKFQLKDFSVLAATMKKEGYKAVKPYLIEAKMMHLDGGGEWPLAWDRKFKLCMKAALRDSGPTRKAKEVPREAWAENTESPEAGKDKTKLTRAMGKAAFAVATHWMLREIELTALKRDDLAFDVKNKKVTMNLRKSKTDTEAKGTVRVLQCTCDGNCGWKCPYEASWRLAHGEGHQTTTQRVDGGHIVLTQEGMKAKKSDVVKTWKALYGMDTTGHSPRRTGALQYIRAGWTIAQVAFLGRWRSQVIYEYAREALETLPVNTGDAFNSTAQTEKKLTNAQANMDANQESDEVSVDAETWQKERMEELELEIEALKMDHKGTKESLMREVQALEEKANTRGGLLPKLVFSGRAQVMHCNEDVAICSPPFSWKTLCGWRYGGSNFTLQDGAQNKITCQKCKAIAFNREAIGRGLSSW